MDDTRCAHGCGRRAVVHYDIGGHLWPVCAVHERECGERLRDVGRVLVPG